LLTVCIRRLTSNRGRDQRDGKYNGNEISFH
jgi:hypothetical protein